MLKGAANVRSSDWRSCAILAVPAIQNITQIVRILPYSLQNSVVFSMETGGCAAKSLHRRYGKIHHRLVPILGELGALAVAHRYGQTRSDVATCPAVATCRQTVEALLAPLSTAWQPMATVRSGWLDLARYFRNTSPKVVSGR